MSYKRLVEEYESLFGIQGSRIEKLTRDEMETAINTRVANPKAPKRGSRKNS